MSFRNFKTISSYVQGRNILENAGEHLKQVGNPIMVIADAAVLGIIGDKLKKSAGEHSIDISFVEFKGECTNDEIQRLGDEANSQGIDVIVGAGGGKALDTAKVIGTDLDIAMVSLPTIASNDSPTSAVSVVYTEEKEVEEIKVNKAHPALVLVDSGVIAAAPSRFFVAGMGDALATKFEANACYKSKGKNILGGKPTSASIAISDRCYSNLRDYGLLAKKAVEKKLVNEYVETIIESNILLSGLGFENGGLALAHAIHNGFSHWKEIHNALHGEIVCFGVIVQLIIENNNIDYVKDMIHYCISLGLPVTLEELGVKNVDNDELSDICNIIVTKEKAKVDNEPIEVTSSIIRDSVLLADEIGAMERGI